LNMLPLPMEYEKGRESSQTIHVARRVL